MKKTLILSAFLAAFAFAGCNKAEKAAPAAVHTRTVSFQAVSQDTKAAFTSPNGNEYPVLWTENDTQVAVVQNYDDATNADVTVSGDKKTASFEAELKTGAEENKLIAVIPASSVRSVSSTNKTLNIEIPAAQTSSLTSPDEDAMVLYAKESLGGTIPASVNLTFQHFSAYLHLSFSNYADALTAAGASVQAVSITSAKEIAGRAFFYPETGTVSANAMFKTVTVSTATLEDVWAGLVPVDFSGETLTLVVNTDKGTMTRNITFPDGRNLTSGKVANIPVDMSGISLIEPVVYKLVTSENQLHVGDKVIVAAANYDVAISTTQNKNNRATAGITKGDGVILDPAANVEVITLEDGVKPGEYALKAGAGYLYAASLKEGTENLLRTAAADAITPELAKYGSWNISIFDTVQKDNNSEKTETQNAAKVIAKAASQGLLRYNGANNLFSAYQDNHGSTYLIHLYRLDKPADDTPRFKATMPDADSDNKVTASSAGGELEVYVFGNTAWTASVTEGATLSATSGTGNAILTLSVPENTSTTDTKSYTVTVSTTASVTPASYVFTITQSKKIDAGAELVVVYSLEPTGNDGTQNTFAGNSDANMGGIVWNITGNGQTGKAFWRIGGKSLNGVNRGFYSKTALPHEVTKVVVSHGTVDSGCTVNSFTFTVHSSAADAASGANPIATLSGTVVANGNTTFEKPDDTSWSGCYYRFMYNFTVTSSSNKRLEFTGAQFWGYSAE